MFYTIISLKLLNKWNCPSSTFGTLLLSFYRYHDDNICNWSANRIEPGQDRAYALCWWQMIWQTMKNRNIFHFNKLQEWVLNYFNAHRSTSRTIRHAFTSKPSFVWAGKSRAVLKHHYSVSYFNGSSWIVIPLL